MYYSVHGLGVSIGGLSVILLEQGTALEASGFSRFNRRVVGYTTGAWILFKILRNSRTVSIGGLSVILLELHYGKKVLYFTCFNRRVVGYTTGA